MCKISIGRVATCLNGFMCNNTSLYTLFSFISFKMYTTVILKGHFLMSFPVEIIF